MSMIYNTVIQLNSLRKYNFMYCNRLAINKSDEVHFVLQKNILVNINRKSFVNISHIYINVLTICCVF